MRALYYPHPRTSGALEDLGKFTGHFWSDTLALEPFICEAIHNQMHAQVEGDAIMFGERAMSPSQLPTCAAAATAMRGKQSGFACLAAVRRRPRKGLQGRRRAVRRHPANPR